MTLCVVPIHSEIRSNEHIFNAVETNFIISTALNKVQLLTFKVFKCAKEWKSVSQKVLKSSLYSVLMMTSSNGNIFRVAGSLCGDFTGHRWIPRTKASDAELWCFLWSAHEKRLSKRLGCRWFETQSRSLWCHCNVSVVLLLHISGVLCQKQVSRAGTSNYITNTVGCNYLSMPLIPASGTTQGTYTADIRSSWVRPLWIGYYSDVT